MQVKMRGQYHAQNWGLFRWNSHLAPKFTNCKIHHNKAFGWGGGIRLSAIGTAQSLVSPVFENVLIYADSSQTGGAISYEQSVGYINATFINCTVANNPGSSDLVMQSYGDPGGLTFKNSIFHDVEIYATDTIACFNSNFDIDDTSYCAGSNNVYGDPTYINMAGGDYRPGCSSQAVNGGNNAYTTQIIDLAGVTRIIGLAVDMGAYETNYPAGPTVTANANYLAVCDPGTTNLILFGTGANTYAWTPGAFNSVTDSVPTDLYVTTTYTVTGYDLNMCSDTASITIIYASLPTATAPADYNICATDSVLLQGTASGGTAPYAYEWRDGSTNIVATDNNSYVTLNSYEYFYMYVTDANGCQANDLVEVYVTASANITGTAYVNATPLIYGNAYLFRMNVVNLVFDTVATYPIAGGTYDFGPMPFGNYVLKIDPDTSWHPEAVPTYYGGGFQWDSAMVITHSCLSPFTADVYLNTLLGGTGTGKITGHLIEAQGFGTRVAIAGNNQIMVPGGPLKGVDIKLGKNPGGGIQSRTMSDNTGFYSFDSLPDDTYRIYVDIPGLSMDSFYIVTINSSIDTLVNLDYYADSNSVYPSLPVSVGLHQYASSSTSSFEMYPNPTKHITNLVFTSEKQNRAEVRIVDVTGKVVMNLALTNLPKGKHEYQLNFDNQHLQSGIYFVELLNENGRQTKKLIIE